MKQNIEIFTAGCPVCDPVIQLVKETACNHCEITIYNLSHPHDKETAMTKAAEYGVKRLPSVAVNGKLLECCTNTGFTKADLVNAGMG